jgi:TonB-linked SusC/RagA family outer membrane protein
MNLLTCSKQSLFAKPNGKKNTQLLTTQMLKVMKLTFILLTAAFLQVSAKGISQNVTLALKDAPVEKVFKEIERQTGIGFLYTKKILQEAPKVSINVNNMPVADVLRLCFSEQDLDYSIQNNTIIITKKSVAVSAIALPPPPITIRGVIQNETGEPQAGLSVQVKGTNTGTVTLASGAFTIEVENENAILLITGVNIEPIEYALNGRKSALITVKTKISPLDEVQLIGYGSTTKRLKTSSVATIKSDAISKQPVANPIQALQGRMAGVSITQTSGAIGSGVEIQIRGINTIQAGNQPLVIVDGAIMPDVNRGLGTAIGGYMPLGSTSMNALNPADIESIEILKDADATAIYGSRGSNGVVLITSKKAKFGATRFNMDVNTWSNSATYLPERLTLPAYLQMRKDAFAMGNHNPTTGIAINPITPTANTAPDLLVWDQTKASADWTEYEFGNTEPSYNVQANLSGGDKRLNFYTSGGFQKQKDITRGSPSLERISGNLNVNHSSSNDRLSISLNTSYIVVKLKPSRGGGSGGLLASAPPNMPLRNTDGSAWWPNPSIAQSSLLLNPVATEEAKTENQTKNLISNIDLTYKIFKGLKFKTLLGYNDQIVTTETGTPSTAINPLNPGTTVPSLAWAQSKFRSFNFEPQLLYNGKIAKGKFEALVGSTFFDRKISSNAITFNGFSSDLLLYSWAAATSVASRSNTSTFYKFNSVFGRFNYNWENKYLVNLTYRRDGSSRFGPKNQWGNFGAAGLGWIFTKEQWFNNKFSALSYGKLRASYGTSGNDNIDDYRFTSLYSSTLYDATSGLAATYLADSSIGWESSRKLDFALETGFFKDRILFNINWYRTLSTDLLASTPVPAQTGFANFLTNIPAVVENKGWEFELNTQNTNTKSKFQWKTNFNLTLLKNKLKEFPGLEKSSFASRMKIGFPVNSPRTLLNSEWAQIFEGVDPATGLPIFTDLNKDGLINNTDRTYIGSAIPRTFGGLGNQLSYKGFELDIFLQYSQQLVTNWQFLGTYPGQLSNPPFADFYTNYWKNPGDITKYPRLFSGAASNTTTNLLSSIYPTSSAALNDIMYVRLKNLSLSYTLPTTFISKAKISKAVVYLRGQNLLTWTSEKIYKDPELVQLRYGQILKTWTAGIQLSF